MPYEWKTTLRWYNAGVKTDSRVLFKVNADPAPRLLTIQEAAIYLRTSVHAVRQLEYSRQLKFVPIGKRHLFDRLDLDKLVESLKRTA